MYVQGTKPLAYTLSGGRRTDRQSSSSSYAPPRKLSPIERLTSAEYQTQEMPPESPVEQDEFVSTQSNKIPLPQLDRPVYVHFEERPQEDELEMYAM